jgi:polysaccharide pyruvyl transferase CsaB
MPGQPTPKSVLVSGYYGFNNLGDDLILQVLVETLVAQGVQTDQIVVLSQNPAHTQATLGVRAINRWSPVAILKTLPHVSGLVSGGGGLFQDVTSAVNVLYYGGIILVARLWGKPVWIWGQSVGPLASPWTRWLTRWCFQQAQSVWVRDSGSAQLLMDLGLPQVHAGTDAVWALNLPTPMAPATLVGISLRPFEGLGEAELSHLATVVAQVILEAPESQRPSGCALLAMHPQWDKPILEKFKAYLRPHLPWPEAAYQLILPDQIRQTIPQCQWMVGMRFHSVVLGLLAGVRVITLDYDPKVAQLRKAHGLMGAALSEITTLTPTPIGAYLQTSTPRPPNNWAQQGIAGLTPVIQALQG